MDLGKGGCGWHDEAAERERTGGNPWAALRPMTEADAAVFWAIDLSKKLERWPLVVVKILFLIVFYSIDKGVKKP
jgi:hypothetical protein